MTSDQKMWYCEGAQKLQHCMADLGCCMQLLTMVPAEMLALDPEDACKAVGMPYNPPECFADSPDGPDGGYGGTGGGGYGTPVNPDDGICGITEYALCSLPMAEWLEPSAGMEPEINEDVCKGFSTFFDCLQGYSCCPLFTEMAANDEGAMAMNVFGAACEALGVTSHMCQGSGYGGYEGGGGGDWVICKEDETYCYINSYDDKGEMDHKGETVCVKMDDYERNGCPCNTKWEEVCDSFGWKYCEQKSIGCYDPFDITCGEGEVQCKYEFSSYCWDEDWGECPLYCTSNETQCWSSGRNPDGSYNYTLDREFCAPLATGCPCDPVWTPFGSDGLPDWSLEHNQTCHPINEPCPCHPQYEEKCHDNYGTWCQVKAWGSCPVHCTAEQMTCCITPYNADGTVDHMGVWTEQSANITDGCPCNPTWEHQCTFEGQSYCVAKDHNCPLDCGNNEPCYSYVSGNESCPTTAGCVCESGEIGCTDVDTQLNRCWPSEWYPSGCPLECKMSDMYCSMVSFQADGQMLWEDYCLDAESNNWMCPIICDNSTSKKCGTPEAFDEHCVALSDSCPVSCPQQYCWVDNFSPTGEWLGSSESCANWGESCPCGDNSIQCTDPVYGDSYCVPTSAGCPLVCNPVTEKTCYPVSYTLEGDADWSAPVNESCQNITRPCPCGANAKMCRWTDEFGLDNEVCFPSAESCPVTCKSNEQVCFHHGI